MNLAELGATPGIRDAFAAYEEHSLVLARVSFRDRDLCRLYTEAGESEAEIAGALRYRAMSGADLPVVGDWVAARPINPGEALVEAVLPRRTQFSRRAAGRREEEQVVAANVDVVLLVTGLDGDFNLRRLERYLTLAWESGAAPVVVLNKTDVCPDAAARAAEARSVARSAPVVAASAARGEVEAIREWLRPGVTVALLGSSGAGKSTLVNALVGEERQRTVGVRESDSRGRHTTTFRELVPLPGGGALIDTPGMRELQLWADEGSLDRAFDDVAGIARGCRFRDCSHSGERDCAVAAALAEGTLDAARWESFAKLRAEVRRHERLTDRQAADREKRRIKSINKALRQHYKLRRQVP